MEVFERWEVLVRMVARSQIEVTGELDDQGSLHLRMSLYNHSIRLCITCFPISRHPGTMNAFGLL